MVMDRGTAEIQFDEKGEAYFMVDNTAFYLNEFMRADDTPNVGYLTLSNIGGLSASIDPTGEEVYFEFISL